MPPADQNAWIRLGRLLAARRIQIAPRYKNKNLFSAEREINRRMLWQVEGGSRDTYREDTLRAIEAAYMLVPGSVDRTLAGGDLEPTEAADRPHLAAVPDAAFSQPARDEAALDEWLLLLRRSNPELMRQADPVIRQLRNLPHPDGPEGRLRPFRERETLIRALLGEMLNSGREAEPNSGTDG